MTGTRYGLGLAAGAAAVLGMLIPAGAQEPIKIGFSGALIRSGGVRRR